MPNILAIDYGLQHIGLAIATTPLAEPIITAPTSQVITTIRQIIDKYNIDLILIGISENDMANKTRLFADKLTQEFHLPIKFIDETLSSYETRQQIAQANMKKKKRQQKTDHFVAASLLQNYLDESL